MWFSIVQCVVEGERRRRGASAGRTIITFSPEAGVQWNLWSAEKLSRAACGGLFWGVVMVRAGFLHRLAASRVDAEIFYGFILRPRAAAIVIWGRAQYTSSRFIYPKSKQIHNERDLHVGFVFPPMAAAPKHH
ncbi:hypothetical protein HWE04_08545 [Herbaspirillum sp. C7C2]|uniref:hypothetical protein n=1 Tax=Herbaspirillum sp. C7C2 TaxID=2736666 RepID=UPI001F51E7C9|nr:hypothetical protein [Herbaspirillum sp. C7C2]MCI1013900.1 hypothetical protein [Herbaspirillum sp. C7C2]